MGCESSNIIVNNFQKDYQYSLQKDKKWPIPSPKKCPLKPISKQLSGRQIMLISSVLQKHILFYKLDGSQRMKLISSMEKFEVSEGSYIFRVDDQPDYAFIIDSGTVRIELTKEGRQIKKILKQGNYFGDLALMNATKRSASAIAVSDCSLIALSKEVFHKKMEELAIENHNQLFHFVDAAPAFKKLTHTQKTSIASQMHQVKFQKDSVVLQLGDNANSIYLIKSGEIQLTFLNKSSLILKKEDIFGYESLKSDSMHHDEAKVRTNTHCLVISKNKLLLSVETSDIDGITYHSIICCSLKRTAKFANASNAIIERIIDNGEISMIQDGAIIATAGQELTKMMVCLQGDLVLEDIFKTVNTQEQQIIGVGCVFNEDYESPIKIPHTIIKKSKGSIFSIQHKVLRAILHPIPHRMSISLQIPQPQFELKNFQLIKKLQSGSLASKYLVMDIKAKQSYIMHVYSKFQVVQYKKQKLISNDKELNQSLRNMFVINILKTFKDNTYVYFVYREYLNFTLDCLIKRVSFPSIQTIDFIAMAIINFLEYLHKELIIFRDLKPQNIILDKNGYPHFLSFTLAKKVTKQNCKTYTIIGTPHYLAPEVQQGLGYSFPSDYWSLGIILYQLAIGYLPFADDKEDPYSIFIAIQKQKLTFPKSFTNKKLKKLIKLLLCKQSWNRPDHTNIKTCGYFDQMTKQKWQHLSHALLKPPTQIQKLVSEFQEELVSEALNETQGSFMAIFQKHRLKHNNPAPKSLGFSWDQDF